MPLPTLIEAIEGLPELDAVAEALPGRGARVSVSGLHGSSDALLIAALARRITTRLILVVSDDVAGAERWLADLSQLVDAEAGQESLPVAFYPPRESFGEAEPHAEIAGERVETLERMARGAVRIVITTSRAILERTQLPGALESSRLEIRKGDTRRPESLAEHLESIGFERVAMVEDVAQFSVRGGIFDIYSFGMAEPVRLEFWGDDITELRHFDLVTQRSTRDADVALILPVDGSVTAPGDEESERSSIRALFPPDTLLVVPQGTHIAPEVERTWSEAEHHIDLARRRGEDTPDREELYESPETMLAAIEQLGRLDLEQSLATVAFPFRAPEIIHRDIGLLKRVVADGVPTIILCDNAGQAERLDELLNDDRISSATLAIGVLQGGFLIPPSDRSPGLRVLTDHEIFRRERRIRRSRKYAAGTPVESLTALKPGDYVVHLEHGVGIYRGMEKMFVRESTVEVAVIEYEGGDRLNVPPLSHRSDRALPLRRRSHRRLSAAAPPLTRRKTVEAAARQDARRDSGDDGRAARSLCATQSRDESAAFSRHGLAAPARVFVSLRGHARPAHRDHRREGRHGAPAADGPASSATSATERPRSPCAPRSRRSSRAARLSCSVPTTILADQHARTFEERLADFPISVKTLSRFQNAKEQAAVIAGLKEKKVDIVIGTHRLLSPDVAFSELGLIVVDEEHRFGVKHKERLKRLKLETDVLTLTATPIPRTLHLSLAGLRDMTLMQTPPRDRSPVLTYVEPWDDGLIDEGISRELDRGGQVFFVHNRIETIDGMAEHIRRVVPRARVGVGHGQMRERELEEVMRTFVDGEIDVLVSTMIVESGLDVPNANTMFVNRADTFGLAQLYQLRGRVGRSHRRASCYLLVPDSIDEDANRRLTILEHHTQLGAGYQIALKDLELRGAGNLLGPGAVGIRPRRRVRHVSPDARRDGQAPPARRRRAQAPAGRRRSRRAVVRPRRLHPLSGDEARHLPAAHSPHRARRHRIRQGRGPRQIRSAARAGPRLLRRRSAESAGRGARYRDGSRARKRGPYYLSRARGAPYEGDFGGVPRGTVPGGSATRASAFAQAHPSWRS